MPLSKGNPKQPCSAMSIWLSALPLIFCVVSTWQLNETCTQKNFSSGLLRNKSHTKSSVQSGAKKFLLSLVSEWVSVMAVGLCIGCPRSVYGKKVRNSYMQEFFCSTLHVSLFTYAFRPWRHRTLDDVRRSSSPSSLHPTPLWAWRTPGYGHGLSHPLWVPWRYVRSALLWDIPGFRVI